MSNTRAALSFSCPGTPTSGRMRCRLYRTSSDCSSVATISTSRDRRHDDDLVAVAHRGRKTALQPRVVVIHVEGDKGIWLPRLIAQAWGKTRKPRGHIGHDIAEGRAVGFEGTPAVGEFREHCRQLQCDSHDCSVATGRLDRESSVTVAPETGLVHRISSAVTPSNCHAPSKALPTAAARSRGAIASIAEPAPDSVAPYAPACLAADTTAS